MKRMGREKKLSLYEQLFFGKRKKSEMFLKRSREEKCVLSLEPVGEPRKHKEKVLIAQSEKTMNGSF